MTEMHDGVWGGHYMAKTKSHKITRFGFWWPRLFKDTHNLVRRCDPFQRFSSKLKFSWNKPLLFINWTKWKHMVHLFPHWPLCLMFIRSFFFFYANSCIFSLFFALILYTNLNFLVHFIFVQISILCVSFRSCLGLFPFFSSKFA